MRELRALQATLIEVFERFGYGQVATPTLEYDEVLQRGRGPQRGGRVPLLRRARRAARPALRHDDPDRAPRREPLRGLRAALPLLLRRQRLPGRPPAAGRRCAEFMHAGIELLGSPAPEGTAEVLEVLSAALDAVGLNRAVLGLGDADLYRQLLAELGVQGEARGRILDRLAEHNLVGLEMAVDEVEGLDAARPRDAAARCPACGAGRRFSIRPASSAARPSSGLHSASQQTYDSLVERGRRRTGPARPRPAPRPRLLHGRDRRDLRPGARAHPRRRGPLRRPLGRFGPPMPAAGFALYLERVHVAQMEEERVVREGER